MALNVNLEQPVVYENVGGEIFAISMDKLQLKFHKIVPKIDHQSNWISIMGIIVSIIFGLCAYCSTDTDHRPALWAVIIMSIAILVALGFSGYILYSGYQRPTVEELMEEFKDGCTITMADGKKITYHKRNVHKKRKK